MDQPLVGSRETNYRFFYGASASAILSLIVLFIITGLDYNSNYDLVVKWMSEEFHGKTLDILGIKIEPIVDVFY